MTNKLIWAEDLIENAGISRRAAYGSYGLPFAHVIDGELYYEPEPLMYWCQGCTAKSADDAARKWRLMRETTAGGWDQAYRRAEAQSSAAKSVARKGRRRKQKPRVARSTGRAVIQQVRKVGAE